MRNLSLIWLAILLPLLAIGQTTIGGVINAYQKVTGLDDSGCDYSVSLDDASVFSSGDRVLLIQMQGQEIFSQNNSDFGMSSFPSAAGYYEFHTVQDITSSTSLTLIDCTFSSDFDPQNGSVQLIRVPVYENVEVTELLTALAWNGEVGGVLALEVNGTLTLSADLDVSALGFRGGSAAINNDNNCNFLISQSDYFYAQDNWRGAAKGEGIAQFLLDKEHGRGPQGNGGGGGNDHNAGGGGGGNGGAGGAGGNNSEPSTFGCDGYFPGQGGYSVPSQADLFTMGGGGGAGHGNNDNSTPGGNGGGILLLVADTMVAGGHTMSAKGASVALGGGDGAGGGGAGGTIGLHVNVLLGDLQVNCDGGDGGTVDNQNANRCHGPGGGGGAGRFFTNLPGTANLSISLQGGAAGQTVNSSVCDNDTNDATSGMNTVAVVEATINNYFDCTTSNQILADFGFTLLGNGLVSFQNSSINALQFQWDFDGLGSSMTENPEFTFPAAEDYLVTLIVTNECASDTVSQTITVPEFEGVQVLFTLDDGQGCAPHEVQFQNLSTGTYDNILWTFPGGMPENSSAANPVVIYESPGIFDVQLEVFSGSNSEVLFLTELIEILPAIEVAFDYQVNGSEVSFFNNSSNADSYLWNFGDGSSPSTNLNPVHVYTAPGAYDVTLAATSAACGKATTQTVFVDFPSAVQEELTTLPKIFPNPTSSYLEILHPHIESYAVVLRSLIGTSLRVPQRRTSDSLILDLRSLPSGVYWLTCSHRAGTYSQKILKL